MAGNPRTSGRAAKSARGSARGGGSARKPMAREQRRPYWQNTRLQMILVLLLPLVVLPFVPQILTKLGPTTFLGFPIGYLLATHGFIALGILVMAWFVRRQDRIDRLHGTHEDF